MRVSLSFTEQQYGLVRSHLFKGKKEQGCFLFVNSAVNTKSIELKVRDIHKVEPGGWSHQSSYHLELEEEEKVRVMLKARANSCDLVECHSHRFDGSAAFSLSDAHGLSEFVQYVWWKLPGKIYGAAVFTKSDVRGQIWLPKQESAILINEFRVVDNQGNIKIAGGALAMKPRFSIFRGWNNA